MNISKVGILPTQRNEKLDRVWQLLNRNDDLDLLGPVISSIKLIRGTQKKHFKADKERTVFAFDTNALYRLGSQSGTRGAENIDFLRQCKQIIIPGQALQELWNCVSREGSRPSEAAQQLKKIAEDARSIEGLVGTELVAQAIRSIENLQQMYQAWSPTDYRVVEDLLGAVIDIAIVAQVPRERFSRLATVRNSTKTPPGFRDSAQNHGDFFVWCDFLYGLTLVSIDSIEKIVLVTADTKNDWSTKGVVHPVLSAEVESLVGKRLELWTVNDFSNYVKTNNGS